MATRLTEKGVAVDGEFVIPFNQAQNGDMEFGAMQRRKLSELLCISDVWDIPVTQRFKTFALDDSGKVISGGGIIETNRVVVSMNESDSDESNEASGKKRKVDPFQVSESSRKSPKKEPEQGQNVDTWLLNFLEKKK